jgi:hypothetical protein
VDYRTGRALAAAAGAAFAAYGLYALASIPHGIREFRYQPPPGGTAWWPLPFAPLNGFTPEQLSSHVARLIFLLPACVLLGLAFRDRMSRRFASHDVGLLVLTGVVITSAIALLVIRNVPLQDDDATYLMQAELLTRGLAADPAHPSSASFAEPFTIFSTSGMSCTTRP